MRYIHTSMGDVKLEVRHLKLLAAVAEEGSVTGAVKRLNLTQSALSHQLRDAEEKIGAQLFLRLGRRMVLTAPGRRLLASARRVLEELRQAEEQVHCLSGGVTGLIRFSTACYTCYHWLPGVLRAFHTRFPGVDVRIVVDATSRPVAALLEGKLDLGIVSGTLREKKLMIQPLFEDEWVVVMPPGHPLAQNSYVRLRDLAEEKVLIYPPREESTLIQKILLPAGIQPREVAEVALTEAILEMVKAGMGVGFLARWAVAPQERSGAIVTRPLTRRGFRRRWMAATLRARQTPAYLEEFIALIAEQFAPGTKSEPSPPVAAHRPPNTLKNGSNPAV
jgi:LysR family transcriptional regulator for metE and metH